MQMIDTHCHLHDSDFFEGVREEVYRASIDAGVTMICVGVDVRSSREAVEFSATHDQCYPVVGIHPHEAATGDVEALRQLLDTHRDAIVGIGEIGLDYFYDNAPREIQRRVLREQLALAQEFALPVSFHVRAAFDDFWPILDEFPGVHGVLHSFTDSEAHATEAIQRGLFIGINGIATFTKDPAQQEMFRSLPREHIVLETDAPFLTPVPFRGKMNTPAYVGRVAEHLAMQQHVSSDEILRITTENARKLFGI